VEKEEDTAMISISRSLLLAAGLLACPLVGAVAQAVDTGKSTGPSSAAASDKSAASKNDDAMKSTAPGYENKSDVSGGVGKSPGNAAATGQSGKQSQ
jgi:hypothetical protein